MTDGDRDDLQSELLDAATDKVQARALRRIRDLVAQGATLTDQGIDPLRAAAAAGMIETVRLLLSLGARMETELPNNHLGDTALHDAAQHNHVEVIHLLVEEGDGRKFLNHFEPSLSWAPLHTAVKYHHLKAAGALLDVGADINANDGTRIGDTPLDLAIAENDAKMVEFLLSRGANPDIPTWMQITARMRAERASAAIRALFRGR
jgi:ankyrin repeat protein